MLPFSVPPLLPGTPLCWMKSINPSESSQIRGEPTAHTHVGETEAGRALLCPLTFSFSHSHQHSCLCQFLSTRLQVCMDSSLKSISLGSQVLSQILAQIISTAYAKTWQRSREINYFFLDPEISRVPCISFHTQNYASVPSKILCMPAILKNTLKLGNFLFNRQSSRFLWDQKWILFQKT